MAMKKATAKKATVKKSLPKAQAGGYTSSYGGTGANKPKSNKSAVVAGIIGSAVGTAAALLGRKKKKKAKELEKKVKQDVIKEAESREVKKYGGAKKPLKKAQYGQRVYQGPLNKSDIERLDRAYPSTAPVPVPQAPKEAELIRGLNPFVNGQMVSNEEREFMQRKDSENYMRKPKGFYKKGGSTTSAKMQKGGATKSKYPLSKRTIKKLNKGASSIKTSGSSDNVKIFNEQRLKELTKQKKGGSTGDKKWIQKAINPKHKGYCTPMTKATCTPKRKALAITLKKMAKARKGK